MAYLRNVRRDIDRWLETGLIDAQTADRLRAEVEATARRGWSFASVLALLAGVLIAAALMLLVAANWEAMPRLLRVGFVAAAIAAGYVGGAWLKLRGHAALGEGAFVVAAAAFGAGIALIGQMYHLSGDEAQAILVWCLGTVFAAAVLRSPNVTVGAALLAGAWMLMTVTGGRWEGAAAHSGFPLLVLLIWAVAAWTQSRPARHVLLLGLVVYAAAMWLDTQNPLAPLLLTAGGGLLFAFCRLAPEQSERWLGLAEDGMAQGLLMAVAGLVLIQSEYHEDPAFIICALAVFAVALGALLLAGRDSRSVRWLAYAAFLFEVVMIYVVLFGSMLGTAGFFVLCGIVLAVLAVGVRRLERRFAEAS